MHFDQAALGLHVGGGAVALLTFWLPWVVKKGGTLHRRVGWSFTGAMAVVAVTGGLVSTLRLLDGDPGNDIPSLFLGAVGVLAGSNASMGVRSVRTKRRTEPSRNGWDLGVAGMLVIAGVITLALGVYTRRVLFDVFGLLSMASGAAHLRFLLLPPRTQVEWIVQHIGGMGASCIAAVTAFLVVNADRLGFGRGSLLVWIAPGVVGGIGIALWQARYRRVGARSQPPTSRRELRGRRPVSELAVQVVAPADEPTVIEVRASE